MLATMLPTTGFQAALCVATLTFWVVFGIAVAAGSSAGKLNKDFPWQFRFAARMRTPILMFIVVPLSYIRNTYGSIRTSIRAAFKDAAGGKRTHMERVEPIIAQVRGRGWWLVAVAFGYGCSLWLWL